MAVLTFMKTALLSLSLTLAIVATHLCRHPPAAPIGFQPGERVITRRGAEFVEATVVDSRPGVVTVAWDDGARGDTTVPQRWVVRAGTPPAGDWLLCLNGEVWRVCRTGEAAEEVAPLPPGLLAWATRRAQLQLAEPATVGLPVGPGGAVLARWSDGNWWDARVRAVRNAGIVVAWADGSADTILPARDVALLRETELEPGQLVLCRGQGSTRWDRLLWRPAMRSSCTPAALPAD